jgi:hypothetical protein
VRDDFTLIGLPGKLRKAPGHSLASEYFRYHREWFGFTGCQ